MIRRANLYVVVSFALALYYTFAYFQPVQCGDALFTLARFL